MIHFGKGQKREIPCESTEKNMTNFLWVFTKKSKKAFDILDIQTAV